MINGKQAWIILGTGIVAYEAFCDDDQLLSCIADAWVEKHPFLTRTAIMALALHLGNMVSPRFDAFHLGFLLLRRLV